MNNFLFICHFYINKKCIYKYRLISTDKHGYNLIKCDDDIML